MTPAEAVALARKQGHVVIIHKGNAFINSFDEAETERWAKLGAHVVPHWDEIELAARRKKGKRTVLGWEVHLLGACAPVYKEDAGGDKVLITADALLNAARTSAS